MTELIPTTRKLGEDQDPSESFKILKINQRYTPLLPVGRKTCHLSRHSQPLCCVLEKRDSLRNCREKNGPKNEKWLTLKAMLFAIWQT